MSEIVKRKDEHIEIVLRGAAARQARPSVFAGVRFEHNALPEIDFEGPPPQRASGYWRPLPEPGLRLADPGCAAAPFPRVLSFPTLETVRCVLEVPVLPGVLLLDPDQPQGYVREWDHPNPVPPARHYAYAAQWFAFAATLLFLFVKLNLKPSP